MKWDFLEMDDRRYPMKIFFEQRDNSTVSISKKSITVRIPHALSREEMFREILKIKGWARLKILQNPEKFKPDSVIQYINGQEIFVGNQSYILGITFAEKESSSGRIIDNTIDLKISSKLPEAKKSKHISTLISRCLAGKRLPELRERIAKLNQTHFNQNIGKIFFKNNKSNWGSCSEAGNINISTRLLFAPDEVLNYICIHELAHLIEHNHSPEFWKLVERAMPHYQENEKWLKEHEGECTF